MKVMIFISTAGSDQSGVVISYRYCGVGQCLHLQRLWKWIQYSVPKRLCASQLPSHRRSCPSQSVLGKCKIKYETNVVLLTAACNGFQYVTYKTRWPSACLPLAVLLTAGESAKAVTLYRCDWVCLKAVTMYRCDWVCLQAVTLPLWLCLQAVTLYRCDWVCLQAVTLLRCDCSGLFMHSVTF